MRILENAVNAGRLPLKQRVPGACVPHAHSKKLTSRLQFGEAAPHSQAATAVGSASFAHTSAASALESKRKGRQGSRRERGGWTHRAPSPFASTRCPSIIPPRFRPPLDELPRLARRINRQQIAQPSGAAHFRCRSYGACDLCGRMFYKDVAPLALRNGAEIFQREAAKSQVATDQGRIMDETLALILTWTRSHPLARPCRAFAFREFLSPPPNRLKSPGRRNSIRTFPVWRMIVRQIQSHEFPCGAVLTVSGGGRNGRDNSSTGDR